MPDTPQQQDLDLTFLYEIADGSNEFVIESIDMLLLQAPQMLESIAAAIRENNWSVAAAAAHKLKPSMGFFGMLVSQQLLLDIELMAKTGRPDPEQIAAKFDQANELIRSSLAELTRLKSEKENKL